MQHACLVLLKSLHAKLRKAFQSEENSSTFSLIDYMSQLDIKYNYKNILIMLHFKSHFIFMVLQDAQLCATWEHQQSSLNHFD